MIINTCAALDQLARHTIWDIVLVRQSVALMCFGIAGEAETTVLEELVACNHCVATFPDVAMGLGLGLKVRV